MIQLRTEFLGTVSHPAWGEWIEIAIPFRRLATGLGLTPHGVSGLKYFGATAIMRVDSLTPHGVSGLKSMIEKLLSS